jgi:hypothetical protein
VVRARISASLAACPAYDQSWGNTGADYVATVGGQPVYHPRPVPLSRVSLPARIGDTALNDNGVMGYFLNDDYSRFHAVYGAGGQTAALRRALRAGPLPAGRLTALLNQPLAAAAPDQSGYVDTDHLIDLPLDGSPVYLTLLVDPRGRIPVISGWQPAVTEGLAPGPIATALAAMQASFRVGPLLTDPHDIRMPLPAEIGGDWGWSARSGVTGWSDPESVRAASPGAALATAPLHLSEGWLTLSGMFASRKGK